MRFIAYFLKSIATALVFCILHFAYCDDLTSQDGQKVRAAATTVSQVDENRFSVAKERRYLIHDVNIGEGFNLRRDVYMRVANLVRQLREKGHNFIMVLAPLGGIYHWQSKRIEYQIRIPWKIFFDMPSLNRFVPVIDFEDFLKETGESVIDHVFYLQHYAEGWGEGWEEKWNYRPCISAQYYQYDPESDRYNGWFFGYESEVTAKRMDCISMQGQSSTLVPLLTMDNNTARSIFVDRAEVMLHDWFGDEHFWDARRSMRYSKDLIRISNEYREIYLNSSDDLDQTIMTEDWRQMKTPHGIAKGGPYIGLHWRRKDFLHSHKSEIPSVHGTFLQLKAIALEYNLTAVFVGTDSVNESEVIELDSWLQSANLQLFRYVPPQDVLAKYKEGGVSVIDQWIIAHARYFIGTYVSTFSYRIQEDREILGFDPKVTFNRLCPDHMASCEQPAHWTIKYA